LKRIVKRDGGEVGETQVPKERRLEGQKGRVQQVNWLEIKVGGSN